MTTHVERPVMRAPPFPPSAPNISTVMKNQISDTIWTTLFSVSFAPPACPPVVHGPNYNAHKDESALDAILKSAKARLIGSYYKLLVDKGPIPNSWKEYISHALFSPETLEVVALKVSDAEGPDSPLDAKYGFLLLVARLEDSVTVARFDIWFSLVFGPLVDAVLQALKPLLSDPEPKLVIAPAPTLYGGGCAYYFRILDGQTRAKAKRETMTRPSGYRRVPNSSSTSSLATKLKTHNHYVPLWQPKKPKDPKNKK